MFSSSTSGYVCADIRQLTASVLRVKLGEFWNHAKLKVQNIEKTLLTGLLTRTVEYACDDTQFVDQTYLLVASGQYIFSFIFGTSLCFDQSRRDSLRENPIYSIYYCLIEIYRGVTVVSLWWRTIFRQTYTWSLSCWGGLNWTCQKSCWAGKY